MLFAYLSLVGMIRVVMLLFNMLIVEMMLVYENGCRITCCNGHNYAVIGMLLVCY